MKRALLLLLAAWLGGCAAPQPVTPVSAYSSPAPPPLPFVAVQDIASPTPVKQGQLMLMAIVVPHYYKVMFDMLSPLYTGARSNAFYIQVSTNLVIWTNIGSLPMDGNIWHVTHITTAPKGFYRGALYIQ